jgi:hypothetical protein
MINRRRRIASHVLELPLLARFFRTKDDEFTIGIPAGFSISKDQLRDLKTLPEFRGVKVRFFRLPAPSNELRQAIQQAKSNLDT